MCALFLAFKGRIKEVEDSSMFTDFISEGRKSAR